MSELVDASRHYRRGVVLGLSLAELFTVLVFLLLLVLGAYLLIQDETLSRKDSLVNDQRDVLVTVLSHEGTTIEPALPGDLRTSDSHSALMHMGSENRRLRDQLALRPHNTPNAADATTLRQKAEHKRHQDAIDRLTQSVAEMQRVIRTLKDPARESAIDDLQAQVSDLKRANAALSRRVKAPPKLRNVLDEVDRLVAENARLERENASLLREHEAVEGSKGQDSPCWFRPDVRANGEPYERAIYLFDVLIGDDDILVKDVPAPTSVYREQKRELPFDRKGLDQRLSDDEFVEAFEPLKRAAENREVRLDRRCTFYVAVWDATSATNKPRYKSAHNKVVQAVFNTYEYIHEAWPH